MSMAELNARIAKRTADIETTMALLRQGYANANSSDDEDVERLRLQEEAIRKSINDGTASPITLLTQGYRDSKATKDGE